MISCIWLRHDLRLSDNTALQHAAKNSKDGLVALYVIASETWLQHQWSDYKVDFILRRLVELEDELIKLNIPLKIIEVKKFIQIPSTILKFCEQHNISSLFANRELLVDEINRDKNVAAKLISKGIKFNLYDDVTILPPEQVKKANGEPFKVFTPFKKSLLQKLTPEQYLADFKKPAKQKSLKIKSDKIPDKITGFNRIKDVEFWPASSAAAKKRLQHFLKNKVASYNKDRDFPILRGTSKISVYLANGVLSVRQCITLLCDCCGARDLHSLDQGASTWLSELIWRDFYYAIAYHYPQVVKNQVFNTKYKKIPWSKSKANFTAWCEGRTGFPLVDAAMRQLNSIGWMHNRLRMVVAMFLTKTLFINWRWGEDYFMRHLIDGDFASNNGGWQWSASTGTDAAPYFRIFNPTTQSEKFDSTGEFIRKYCPELADCSNKEIHNPSLETRKKCGYPSPIVDYKAMRAKVIAEFKKL